MTARKTHNVLNRYLGLGGILFTLCLMSYGLPPLFTTNSQILTITTILGDCLQFFALFCMWLAVARIYAPNSAKVRNIVIVLDLILIAIGIAFSIRENLANPVTLTQLPSGEWNLNFAFSLGYQIVTAIQYLSLILVGARFALDGRRVTDPIQKARLWGIAFGFFIIGGFYALRPIIGDQNATNSQDKVLVLGLFVTGFIVASTLFLNYIQQRKGNKAR